MNTEIPKSERLILSLLEPGNKLSRLDIKKQTELSYADINLALERLQEKQQVEGVEAGNTMQYCLSFKSSSESGGKDIKRRLTREKQLRAITLFEKGTTIRDVMRRVGICAQTAWGLRQLANVPMCPCGKWEFGHKAWCAWRFSQSPKRQILIKQWHDKQRAGRKRT